MILKVYFYAKENERNPHHSHIRIIEVTDFHVETRSDEQIANDPLGDHEICYHAFDGTCGSIRVGFDKQDPDHVYIMENGKTVDHMKFYKSN